MKKILLLNKKEGETPLETLGRFRAKNKKYKDVKMTYAGRLDPMASGLLLVLAGEKVKNQEKYLKLDKEYEFEVLFGFATDTYDILGKILSSKISRLRNGQVTNIGRLEKNIKANLKFFRGKWKQKYPLYSSKTVKGKQLWQYGRENLEPEIPEREVMVKKLQLSGVKTITSQKLLQNIEKRVAKVSGDFRQKEILKTWRQNLNVQHSALNIASFKIKCSSGTYVRGIADLLGAKMSVPALAFSIKRTKIGKFGKIT